MRNPNRLEFSDFLRRAKERGLAGSRQAWRKYEKEGLIKFRVANKRGWRVFKSYTEIDKLLDEYEKNIS